MSDADRIRLELAQSWARLRNASPERAARIVWDASGLLDFRMGDVSTEIIPARALFGRTRHAPKAMDTARFLAAMKDIESRN